MSINLQLSLELKNVSSSSRQLRIIPPSTKYFSVGLGWWNCLYFILHLSGPKAMFNKARFLFQISTINFSQNSLVLGKFPGEHGLVAPGLSCQYPVKFAPDSLGDYDDVLKVSAFLCWCLVKIKNHHSEKWDNTFSVEFDNISRKVSMSEKQNWNLESLVFSFLLHGCCHSEYWRYFGRKCWAFVCC